MLNRPKTIHLAAIVIAFSLLTACSSTTQSGQANQSGGQTGTYTGPTLPELAAAQQTLPTLPAVAAKPGANVWIVTCSLEAVGCAVAANAMKTVMENILKWKVTLFDGKLTPATYSAGISQAIVAHADAIVLEAIDCSSVKPALIQAKNAGIPVVSQAGYDCSDPSQGGGKSLFVSSDLGGSAGAQFRAQGVALAQYVAAETKGKARIVIATEPDFQVVVAELEGFKEELGRVCPTCKIQAEAPALGADLASGAAAAKLNSAILQNPDANIMVAMQDSQLPYVTNAIRTSPNKLPIVSSGGSEADIQRIENKTIVGVMANDFGLSGWTTSDTTVRLLANAKPIVVDPVATLVDSAHNLPASGGFVATVDYRGAYSKAWGVS